MADFAASCSMPIRGTTNASSNRRARESYGPASFESIDETDSGISSLASDASREGVVVCTTPTTPVYRSPRILRDDYGRCFAAVLHYKLPTDDKGNPPIWCQGLFRTHPRPPGVSHSNYRADDAFVGLRLWPNNSGRYGFHVEVTDGSVVVSRVVEGTPADCSAPRLCEGDRLVTVNGVPMDGVDRVEVVRLIREHGRVPCVPMSLIVRPKDVRVAPHQSPMPLLKESLYYLRRDFNNDQLICDFLSLSRGNNHLSMEVARCPENIGLNRYRDILPCQEANIFTAPTFSSTDDDTRVVLHQRPTDYINASHIKMEIPQNGVVNKFIATQAPTMATCEDFWWMCWQQNVPVVVMLTPVSERGSLKCHRYWPDPGEDWRFGPLSVTCRSQRVGAAVAVRDLCLRWCHGNSSMPPRQVTQLQYVAWPDHGVPDSVDRFLEFVRSVNELRDGQLGPVLVHCSAGVGRTGVLILVDTAACLAESGLPVFPLDLVRAMREQRAGMVQTAEQFAFSCRAILRICNA